ncbi:hypothetical protein C9439_00420 [archaeon SCG-AAA382B04]|nr:hypothetical protein C9439_00420 [archaeon SCG-AAA382B04]
MDKNKIKYLRHLSQIIFFVVTVVLVTGGVCALTTNLGNIPLGIACPVGATQIVATGQLLTGILVATAILLIAILIIGNYFCGWICPIGSLIETFDKIVAKISTKREGNKKSGRFVKLGVLGGALGGSLAVGFPSFCPICPIGTVCRSYRPVQGFMAGLELLILAPVVTLGIITRRFYCKHLCPVGGFLGIFHKFSYFKKRLPAGSDCIECNNCVEACQMDIPILKETIDKVKEDSRIKSITKETGKDFSALIKNPPAEHKEKIEEVFSEHEDITSKECIMCYECTNACPVN